MSGPRSGPGRLEHPPAPEALLAGYEEEVRATAEALRALVREALPGAEERVYPGWKALGYRDAELGYLCGIFPRRDHVRFLLEHGVRLEDPQGLFDGGGAQTRYITIRSPEAVPAEGIRDLLLGALHEAALRRAYR